MGDAADHRPALYLIKNDSAARTAPRPFNKGSAIVLEAQAGLLRQKVVRVHTPEDATALINGLVMALVQALQAQQDL